MKRLLLLPCLTLLATCNRGPLVLVAVSKLPLEARSLQVIATLDGTDAQQVVGFNLSGVSIMDQTTYRFGFRLPDGAGKTLTTSVAAFSDKGCLSATGDARSVDVTTLSGDVSVGLAPVSQEVRMACRTAAPVIQSVQQLPAAPGAQVRKLRFTGWGLRQGVRILLAGQPAAPERLSATEVHVNEPALDNPTGKLQVEARAQNPDQTEDRRPFDLLKVTFAMTTYLLPDGFHPDAIAMKDLNGDGKPDLVLSGNDKVDTPTRGAVAVLLNQGNGQFPSQTDANQQLHATPLLYPILPAAQSVAIGDITGDGRPDLVFSVQPLDKIGVLVNQGQAGQGLFSDQPIYYFSSRKPDHLAIADLNGDGKLDVAVVNADQSLYQGLFTTMAVLLNLGDGTLQQPPTLYAAGTQVHFVVAQDLDGDGRTDLALFGWRLPYTLDMNGYPIPDPGQSPTGGVVILHNFGSNVGYGIFADRPLADQLPYVWIHTLGATGLLGTMVAGDIDGDTQPDLITSGQAKGGFASTGGNTVSVLHNMGGTFAAPADYGAGNRPFWLGLGDLDRDGRPDIAVSNPDDQGGKIAVLLNQGGKFPDHDLPLYPTGPGSSSIVLADFNGDGKLDMAVATLGVVNSTTPQLNQPGTLTIYLNTSP